MNTTVDMIAAVTANEPNCAYASLLAEDSMTWSELHQVWIAAKGEDVESVLNDPACRVRPIAEPVPAGLRGTCAGDVFARLVRMNEGETHARMKRAVAVALDGQDVDRIRTLSRLHAETLATQRDLDRFLIEYPIFTVACLLGVPDEPLPEVVACTGAFVRAIAPGATEVDVTRGSSAADRLSLIFHEMLVNPSPDSLFAAVRNAFLENGIDDPDTLVANVIGFLFQTHDATAGLIGNTIVHLVRNPDASDATQPLRPQVGRIVRAVARADAAVHNTRRFVVGDTEINGVRLMDGEGVLVGLAAANLEGTDRDWSFGGGRHACPGESLAVTITAEGVLALIQGGVIPGRFSDEMRYRPLKNVRIPVFAESSPEVRVP